MKRHIKKTKAYRYSKNYFEIKTAGSMYYGLDRKDVNRDGINSYIEHLNNKNINNNTIKDFKIWFLTDFV